MTIKIGFAEALASLLRLSMAADSIPSAVGRPLWLEVFLTFLRLGCIAFGGPIAHLGYFQSEIVERRRWCTQETFAEIVALAQSLPGPASSQTCFSLGLLRARWAGGLAAWLGFTTPSALLMLTFAFAHSSLKGGVGVSVVHGLQLVAVSVVAQAIFTMRKSLAPDWPRMTIASIAAAIAFWGPATFSTLLAIAFGASVGLLFLRAEAVAGSETVRVGISKKAGAAAGAVFLTLLLIPPLLAGRIGSQALSVFNAFYRTGALVFGGGHVVLPLLEHSVVSKGWINQPTFLAGYSAAQAIPGPLFSFAAYLGAVIRPASNPLLLGLLALVSIFLPGFLMLVAVLPFWSALSRKPRVQASVRGVNSSVVGILVAAFVRPVWTSAVHTVLDFAVALTAFALLTRWKVSPWIVVLGVACGSLLLAIFRT